MHIIHRRLDTARIGPADWFTRHPLPLGDLVLEITRPGGLSRRRLPKPQARDVVVLATFLALALAQD